MEISSIFKAPNASNPSPNLLLLQKVGFFFPSSNLASLPIAAIVDYKLLKSRKTKCCCNFMHTTCHGHYDRWLVGPFDPEFFYSSHSSMCMVTGGICSDSYSWFWGSVLDQKGPKTCKSHQITIPKHKMEFLGYKLIIN